jgi:dipeptidyl aminopeptidase/acylaminoacyl peptidase
MYGLSRALDYLEKDKGVDAKRVAVMGHSRLGKTALWAGALDERFAMVIASCSGEGGASLSRRNFGETIENITGAFPYWFATNFRKYADHADQLSCGHA